MTLVLSGCPRSDTATLTPGRVSISLAFVSRPDVTAKMFGLGLGLAVLIDVLSVRLLIAPAVVHLLGDRAWWLPGWQPSGMQANSGTGRTTDRQLVCKHFDRNLWEVWGFHL